MRVHDVGTEAPDDAPQTPGGREIHLTAWGERHQFESFFGTSAQLAVRVRDERRAVPERAQPVDGHQHLVLTTAPGAGGVDVEGKHLRNWELAAESWGGLEP